MERNLMVAGFGGQGVMTMGKLLSQATCDSTDLNVTFFPILRCSDERRHSKLLCCNF